MKNGTQKNSNIRIRIDAEKIKAYSILLAAAFLSAVAIRGTRGLEHFIGGFLASALLFFFFYRDVVRYQPQYLKKNRMMMLLALMACGTPVLSRLMEIVLKALSVGLGIGPMELAIYGIPVASGAMLVALLFDFHTALVFSFVTSLLMGLWQGSPAFATYSFVGSLAAAFGMMKFKKRTAILQGGLYVLGANLAALATLLLYSGQIFSTTALVSMGFAIVSALLVVAIVSLALPILENLFKVTTDISLLELLDLDHPLMKNLMISAPGTYHHSIIVGNLVEACAEAVGVNPLLARVGAYYHDIGKAKMPEYFIENQASGVSKHERLTPHMSSMILTSHVKEGVDLALHHKLPEEVVDIIQQHHGNSVITYFFEKAKEQPSVSELSADEYKYPGPRPQTRTAALIMMADAVEATSRVLNEPTPARINALVDKVINHIFLAGQLDECELTLKDIYVIKDRFTRILTGILHKRVDYPGFDFNEGKGAGEGQHKQPPKEDKDKHLLDREGLPESAKAAWASKDRA